VKVELFVPCLVDQAAPDTAHATVRVLRRLGLEVHFDRRQTCCGQALFNSGSRREAAQLAERFIYLFENAEAVVAPSGSCVAMIVHHYPELDLHPTLRRGWEALHERVFELSSFLVDRLGIVDLGAKFPHRVVYHPSCHLTRDLGVVEPPLKLLRAVEGIELVGDDLPVECCGFGGAFSVKYSALARRIADRRATALAGTGASYVTGGDDSCLGHLEQAFRRAKRPQKTIHLARILAAEGVRS
jgi:L-lactate dehydrogenase complex protein LldE